MTAVVPQGAIQSAFQEDAFQFDAFQILDVVASTYYLPNPVNCALAGDQLINDRYHEFEIAPQTVSTRARTPHSRVSRLRGEKPSFTTRVSSRGYE